MYMSTFQTALDTTVRRHAPVVLRVQGWNHDTFPKVHFPPKIQGTQGRPTEIDWQEVDKTIQGIGGLQERPIHERAEWMWALWAEQVRESMRDYLILQPGRRVDDLGKCYLTWNPEAKGSNEKQGWESLCQKAIDKLYGHQALPANKRAWFYDHAQVLRKGLGITEDEMAEAFRDPQTARTLWRQRLKEGQTRMQSRQLAEWRKSLTINGQPSPKLYRWLRTGAVAPPIALKTSEGVVIGPDAVLRTFLEQWTPIMRRDPREKQDVLDWLGTCQLNREDPSDNDVDLLRKLIRHSKTGTSSGMDGWPAEVIKALPDESIPVLARSFARFEEWACWPEQLTLVRTHMLPKTDGNKLAGPEEWRPIALSSCWMRLWAKWKLAMLGDEFFDRFALVLTGGLPGRQAQGSMLEFLLSLEEVMQNPEEEKGAWYGISVDASKCFDRIRQMKVLEQAIEMGMPARTLRGVASYLVSIRRRFSCGGFMGQQELQPTNGLLQGDPLSVVLCNVCIQTWVDRLSQPGLMLQVYIDDRTLAARDPNILAKAWQESLIWDDLNSWKTNLDKTCSLMWGRDVLQRWREAGGATLPILRKTTVLGQDVCTRPSEIPNKQRARIDKAGEVAGRLQRLRLPPDLTQKLISAVVLPKLAYGLVQRPLPVKLLQKIRTRIKAAMTRLHRAHSWEALMIIANPGHRTDPEAYQIYTHLMAVVGGLRGQDTNCEMWRSIMCSERQGAKSGPFWTANRFLTQLGITQGDEDLSWHHGGEKIRICEHSIPEIKHFLRRALRHWFARKAEQARAHLQGLSQSELEHSRKYTKKAGYPFRKELIALMSDGLWLNQKKFRCGLIESPQCPMCHAKEETITHVLYDCQAWRHHWGEWEEHREHIQSLEPCTSLCGHMPAGLKPPIQGKWHEVQNIMATIIHERMEHGGRHREQRREEERNERDGGGNRAEQGSTLERKEADITYQHVELPLH